MPHARMLLVMPPAHPGMQPSAMSIAADAHGRAVLASDLQPGSYRVEPDQGLQGQPVNFELRARSSSTQVTLRLLGSAAIVVAVSDEQGRGVSGLQLNARALADDGGAERSVGVLAQARSSLGVLAVEVGGGRYRMGPLASGGTRSKSTTASTHSARSQVSKARSFCAAGSCASWRCVCHAVACCEAGSSTNAASPKPMSG